jgi:hypothetical protein
MPRRDRIRLKHALAVVALEHGDESWAALKASEDQEAARMRGSEDVEMYERSVMLNRWFTTYDEARASLDGLGGFLFPYRQQFYVCESEGVRELGLDPNDPDWDRIGRDWVKPADREAWLRLRDRRRSRVESAKAGGRE